MDNYSERLFNDQIDLLDSKWEGLDLQSTQTGLDGKSNGELHRLVLEEASRYFGWDNWLHYQKRRNRQAKKLVNQVYHLSITEKIDQIRSIRTMKIIETEVGPIKLS